MVSGPVETASSTLAPLSSVTSPIRGLPNVVLPGRTCGGAKL
jgi:hypothetical protein